MLFSNLTLSMDYLKARYEPRLRLLYNRHDEKDFVPAWRRSTPEALDHFLFWVGVTLAAKEPTGRLIKWCLLRTNEQLPYGPDNCELVTRKELLQRRPFVKLTPLIEQAMVAYKEANPELNDTKIAKAFYPHTYSSVRAVLVKHRQSALCPTIKK
jgi:hypothetical protein